MSWIGSFSSIIPDVLNLLLLYTILYQTALYNIFVYMYEHFLRETVLQK